MFFTKLGVILSICSQDIEWKGILTSIKGRVVIKDQRINDGHKGSQTWADPEGGPDPPDTPVGSNCFSRG